MGSIDNPDLFACLLDPLVSKAAIRADFARTRFGQRINGIPAQTIGGTVYVDAAVFTS